MTETILTPDGKKKLLAELNELKANRKNISERIAQAKEMGDLKENAEYHEARDAQGFNEGKIQEIEAMLRNAVVQTKGSSAGTVQLGSVVSIKGELGEKQFTIVGANEASLADNKISIESPLAQAMAGKKVNDECEFMAPAGTKKFIIDKIS